MKKIITIIAALSLCASAYALMPTFGVRAGLGLSRLTNFKTESEFSYPMRPSVYVGVSSEFEGLLGMMDLRVDAYLTGQGQRMKSKTDDIVNTLKTTYLNIPVMAQYKVLDDKLSLMAGPQLGVCFGGKNVFRSGKTVQKTKLERDEYSRFDLGLVLGAEYDIANGFGVELLLDFGLTNSLHNTAKTYANRCLQIGATYKF